MQSNKAPPARLFHFLRAIHEITPFSEMSADEEGLLGHLIVRWHQNEQSFRAQDIRHTSE
jgi:hypothetical protein